MGMTEAVRPTIAKAQAIIRTAVDDYMARAIAQDEDDLLAHIAEVTGVPHPEVPLDPLLSEDTFGPRSRVSPYRIIPGRPPMRRPDLHILLRLRIPEEVTWA